MGNLTCLQFLLVNKILNEVFISRSSGFHLYLWWTLYLWKGDWVVSYLVFSPQLREQSLHKVHVVAVLDLWTLPQDLH